MPLVRIRDVVRGKSDTYFDGDYDDRYVVNDGDYLIGMDGQFNLARWNGGRALLNQRVCKIEDLSPETDRDYLARFLPKALKDIEDATPFVTVKHLSVKQLRDIDFPLPPLAEQKRIAGILDAADALRAKRRESIDQLDRLIQSTFLEMFGDPKEAISGSSVRKGFKICKLGDQITLQRGIDITKSVAIPGSVPVISSGGVSFYHNEHYAKGPGVLLGRKGSVGKVHIVYDDYWPHDTTLFVKTFNDNDPVFVYYFFLNFPISDYEASAANPSLNRNNLHPLRVLWPTKQLQGDFRMIQMTAMKQIDLANIQLSELDTLFASLQSQAFSGAL